MYTCDSKGEGACETDIYTISGLTILLDGDLALWARLDVGVVLDKPLVGFNPPSSLQVLGVDMKGGALFSGRSRLATWALMISALAVTAEYKL